MICCKKKQKYVGVKVMDVGAKRYKIEGVGVARSNV